MLEGGGNIKLYRRIFQLEKPDRTA